MPRSLDFLAEFLSARLVGDGALEVCRVASLANARPGDLVFVEAEKHLQEALASQATAIIAGEFAIGAGSRKALLIVARPRLAFATAASVLYESPARKPGIHSTAQIDSSATLSPSASVGAYAVIEANAVIGERTWIAPGSYIGPSVVIGEDCEIYPRVAIYAGTILGRRVIVHAGAVLGSDGFGFVRDEEFGRYVKFPQIGELVIGDYVEIGANCTIDRGALERTVVASGTKLDNMVHIGHNTIVGANVVIAAQTGVSGSSKIGDGCIVGGQVGIADHVTIEAGAILGAQCGVPSNKTIRGKGVVFWGTPARPIRDYLRELALLSRLSRTQPGK